MPKGGKPWAFALGTGSVMRGEQIQKWDRPFIMKYACIEPYCRAAKTWPCTTRTGKPSSTIHVSRYHRGE